MEQIKELFFKDVFVAGLFTEKLNILGLFTTKNINNLVKIKNNNDLTTYEMEKAINSVFEELEQKNLDIGLYPPLIALNNETTLLNEF